MKEKDKIQFESIPNFTLDVPHGDSTLKEKEYDSLYEELHEKCNPDMFMHPFVKERFDAATEIYSELRKRCSSKSVSDSDLKDLRDKAESELGIHFSTNKLFKHLTEYCSPDIYTKMKPFPTERVKEASRLYAKILQYKDDIHALEEIEQEAESFIQQRVEDIHRYQQEINRQQKASDAEVKRTAKEKWRMQLWILSVWIVFTLVPEVYFGYYIVFDILLTVVILASIALAIITFNKKNIRGCITSIIILILAIFKGAVPGFNTFPVSGLFLTSTVFSIINIFKRNRNKAIIWGIAMMTSLYSIHPYIIEDILVSLTIIGFTLLVRLIVNLIRKSSSAV